MSFVYRVQDNDGRGPWKPGFSLRWVEDRQDLENLVPWFTEFGNVASRAIAGMKMGSACRTLEQLRRWFIPQEYEKLKTFGYHAVRMEVMILAESDIQCFFQRARSLNEDIEIVELYPAMKL